MQPGVPCSTIRHLAGSASRHLATSPLCPGCPSLPLLLVWMNVSSLSPWLSDFHTVWFSVSSGCFMIFFFYLKTFYLFYYFLERGKGGRKRGRETSVCGWPSCVPHQGPGPQPRHVSWLGIEPATFWFAGPCSIHWATPARFFVLKLLSFFWLCEEAQYVYLCLHLGQKPNGNFLICVSVLCLPPELFIGTQWDIEANMKRHCELWIAT